MPSDFSGTKRRLLPASALAPMGATTIRDLDASTYWFSPLQPIAPVAPSDYRPRQFAYQPGANLVWQPKGDSPISYETLRALADSWDLLRIAIQRKKNQICAVKFEIQTKRDPSETRKSFKDRNANDDTAIELNRFFQKPDGFHTWKQWLRMWLEDMLVIDAVALYLERDPAGKIGKIHPLAGDTINRMLTDQGITADPPSVAYQQVVYGMPVFNFTTDDMVFAMQNERTDKRYGFSPVEQVLATISLGLRRQEFQIAEYTSGNIPEALVFLPSDLPIDRVKEAQDHFDQMLAGDLQQRRRLRFLPGYGSGDSAKPNVVFPKQPIVKDELDVWLAQVVCGALGLSAQPFMKMLNRASAEEANDASEQEGLKPDIDFVVDVVNNLLARMGFEDKYECMAQHHRDVDPLKSAQADDLLAGKVYTSNELRVARGEDPDPNENADKLGSWTQKGFIPMDQPVQPDPVPGDTTGTGQHVNGAAVKPNGKVPEKKKPNGAVHA